MILHVINSNSSGNAYVLKSSTGEILLIELGVKLDRIKTAINWDLRQVAGAIVSHSHLDHCCSMRDAMQYGIKVWASRGTHEACGTVPHHKAKILQHGVPVSIGSFRVQPFDVKHDCPEPFGFLIHHPESGTILFLTDSYFVEYTFPGLNQVIIEANYDQEILDDRLRSGQEMKFRRDRNMESHMSIQTTLGILAANDLRQVENVVLIHLSNDNSHAENFHKRVTAATGKTVTIADAGITIPFDSNPY